MRILVIDQCSGSKDYPSGSPSFEAAELDEHSREALLDRDGVAALPARKLYAGRQQQYIDEAVDALRAGDHSVDRVFVSAGFGVVDEQELLPPYEVTFQSMSAEAIDERSQQLGIANAIKERLADEYDVVFFALGADYYRAIDLEPSLTALPDDSLGVVFNQGETAVTFDNVVSIDARTSEAKELGTIVVALKGVYLQNFADHVIDGADVESPDDLLEYCTTEYQQQQGLDEF